MGPRTGRPISTPASSPAAPPGAKTALVTGPCALVSGATGFLGGRLAAALVARGYRVRALARPTSDTRALVALGVEIVQGDLDDVESLARAAEGQRLVFHTAGRVSDWGPRDAFFRANVGGTERVVAACRRAGVERLLHVSSLTVLGLPRDGRTVDEATPCAAHLADPYSASKLMGERAAMAAHAAGGLAVTVVRPGVIWGPGDVTIVPRLAALLRSGALVHVDGGRNLIGLSHVENLVEGILLAAESPAAAGRLYHLTDGEELTAHDAVEALAATLGVPPPRRSLPYGVVLAAAGALELVARIARSPRPPAMTRYGVRLVSCHCRYDLARSRRELGYAPRVTFRDGVRQLAGDPAMVAGATPAAWGTG